MLSEEALSSSRAPLLALASLLVVAADYLVPVGTHPKVKHFPISSRQTEKKYFLGKKKSELAPGTSMDVPKPDDAFKLYYFNRAITSTYIGRYSFIIQSILVSPFSIQHTTKHA